MAKRRHPPRLIAILGRLCLGSIFALCAVLPGTAQSQEVTIFAAASTTGAVQDAARAFEQASGVRVRAVFAASSTLAKQVAAGAPADLYLSASSRWMDYLEERGRVAAETRVDLPMNRRHRAPVVRSRRVSRGSRRANDVVQDGRLTRWRPTRPVQPSNYSRR